MSSPLAHHVDAKLVADPARVIARLFLPGEEPPVGRSRTGNVVARVLALPEDEIDEIAAGLMRDFGLRHANYAATLRTHASIVGSHLPQVPLLSAARTLVLGASFTAEYSVEGAALCNPSAILHPDQVNTSQGQVRAAVSLRGIGEGHISCIGFATALIGPGPTWTFEPRVSPTVSSTTAAYLWSREHLRAVLADQAGLDELTRGLLAGLPDSFTESDMARALSDLPPDLLTRPGSGATLDALRRIVTSAYEASFDADTELSQRVLLPSTDEERNGMEDARFVQFTAPDGRVDYRATYTAYDGHRIAPRLLTSQDLITFRAQRLAGPAARNKGMALFPRLIRGRHWSLCRSDGESTSVAASADGLSWEAPVLVQAPQAAWEVLQLGNCGPPIETGSGWLVLTHGVGPMRTYAIGAILLDLDDPTRLLRRLEQPLLATTAHDREGYVPNVVYSCGGLIHEGRLWLPYGIGDARVGVIWSSVDELLAAMNPVAA